jgi:hypothetical protein
LTYLYHSDTSIEYGKFMSLWSLEGLWVGFSLPLQQIDG